MKRQGKKQNRSGKRKVSSRSHIDENGDVHARKHDRKDLLRSFMRDDSVAPTDSSSVEIAHDRVFRRNASINRKSRRSLIPGVNPRDNSLLDCKASSHIVCAISENLAKETCIASIDASSPISLTVVKQGNGQTYVETLAYLGILRPDEILLNEGRRNSLLVEKILSQFGDSKRRSEMKTLSETGSTTRSAVARIPVNLLFGGRVVSTNEKKSCKLEREGYESVIKFLPRSCFDQTKGADLLRRIARPESYDASIVEEYILLSSAYSVLQYAQSQLGANFSEKCLQLSMIVGGKSRMSIDRSTLLNLELLANSKTGKIQNSLIGTIDSTKTSVGCRLLRANLMAPPLDVNTINTRLDLVDAFIGNEQFFFQVMDHLEALPDINRMLAGIALIPWNRQGKREDTSASQRVASKGISSLICIKSLIEMMDSFAQVLDDRLRDMDARDLEIHRGESDGCHTSFQSDEIKTDCSSLQVGLGNSIGIGTKSRHFNSHHLLRAIRFVMRQPALREILDAINDVFTESTSYASRSDAMRHQVCFALKPKTDGMLDVLRSTFLANVDDIYRLADEYAEKYNLRITVKHSAQRGYFLAITSELDSCLPDVMIQVVKCGRLINCTTEEVHSLNARAQDNIHDLLILTHEYIQEVMNFAREKYDALASLSDAIALLDLCHSFADNVTASSLPWTRPIITKGGDLTIRNGRYGIDAPSGLAPPRASKTVSYQFVPNHTYAPAHKNFVIITGANGSGKVSSL
jgi:DNA mismatch repair protein MSH4